MEKLKAIMEDYGLWGIFLSVITILIKPFMSIRQSLRDMLITFIVSMLSGLLVEYMDMPVPVKYGISGVCGLFGVRLYMIADTMLKSAETDPFRFFDILKGKKPRN